MTMQGDAPGGDSAATRVKLYVWSFGTAEFDESRWELKVAGAAVPLERRPLEVLQYLLRHAGEAVTREELIAAAWAGRIVVEAVLTNAIGKLRRALQDDAQETIATLPRVGYRLSVPVSRRPAANLPRASLLSAGDSVPRRPHWKLETELARRDSTGVWLARHSKTHEPRVFKFSLAGEGLQGLKREVTIARLLREGLGERTDFVPVLDWDFEEAPYFIESAYGGVSLDAWRPDGGIGQVPLHVRLAMFADAAEAVAAAHALGVLHKDLKPANLLVHEDDGRPRLRVADFGSGNLLDSGTLDALGITHLGLTQARPGPSDSGTPLYLAPEVVAGQSPTTSSDIYALGVTLYQLVAGDFRRTMAPGWETAIDDPLLCRDIAAAANGDPARRPPSAAVLADNIRNLERRREEFELQRAVEARIAAGEKRLARARARRPWLLATMAVLVAGLGLAGWQLQQTLESERAAARERDVAQALNEFVGRDILAAANPMVSGSATTSIREALDHAAPKIENRFAAQPEIAAPLHAIVARAYYQLSDYPGAIRHYRAAAGLFARVAGEQSASTLHQRARLAEALARSGDVAGARAQLARLAPGIAALGPQQQPAAKVRYDLADAWTAWQAGDFPAAVAPLEDAAAALVRLPEPDPELEMEVQQALIMARGRAGLPVADLVKLQEAAIVEMQASRNEHKMPLLLSARYGLLRARMLAGEERELEPDYRKLISELTELLGPRNVTTLLAKHGLAHIYMKQQKWPECQRLMASVHGDLARILGPSNIQSVNSQNGYGACLLGDGKVDEAGKVLTAALAAVDGEEGLKAGLVRVAVQVNLGHVLAAQGRWDELAPLLQRIQRDGGRLLEADSDAAGEVALIQGRLLAARGDRDGAIVQLRTAVRELSKKNDDGYWLVALGQRELARASGGK